MPHRGLSGTNLKFARDHNTRVTLQAVRLHGPVSRPELAQITGLTPQAIAYMCRALLDDGMIIETGRRRGGRGQPAAELSINPDGGYSIGVNIDRDHLTVLLLDLAGTVRGRVHWEENFILPEETLRRIERAYFDLLDEAGLSSPELVGVGLGIPYRLGYLRSNITPRSYAVWRDFPVRERLQAVTGQTVYVENDASAAAHGEIHYGLGIDFKNFLYVYVGVGLGGALVVNGELVAGLNGLGGEIGFIPAVNGTGRPDERRTIQSQVSLGALYAHLARAGIDISSPGELGHLHLKGCRELPEWIERAADSLLMTLITVVCVANPEAILIGGRLPAPLINDLIATVERRIVPYRSNLPSFPPILKAACAADAAPLGAAILPYSDVFLPHLGDMAIRGGAREPARRAAAGRMLGGP